MDSKQNPLLRSTRWELYPHGLHHHSTFQDPDSGIRYSGATDPEAVHSAFRERWYAHTHSALFQPEDLLVPLNPAGTISLSLQALGHAIITPAIGVTGTPVRADVTRVSSAAPCGNGVNVAAAIPGSDAAQAVANAFNVTITNFNGYLSRFLHNFFSSHIGSHKT